jgi:hypothetical protein
VGYQLFHAGFGDQGFTDGGSDATVLTWDAFDPLDLSAGVSRCRDHRTNPDKHQRTPER